MGCLPPLLIAPPHQSDHQAGEMGCLPSLLIALAPRC